MNKVDRKVALKKVEFHLRRGISLNSNVDTLDAYRYLEILLSGDGIYIIGDKPKYPLDKVVDVNEQFDIFFHFPTKDKSQVSSESCKMFGNHIADMAKQKTVVDILELTQGMNPDFIRTAIREYLDDY